MRRLTAFLLMASVLVPGLALASVCCHASEAAAPSRLEASCCCPVESGCGLSAEACEQDVLRRQEAVPVRLSAGDDPLPGAFASFSSWIIRSWWTHKIRLASTDPPQSFHPLISLPLRL